jgi:pimeloyl-ACP methyl ester carboxylesterase
MIALAMATGANALDILGIDIPDGLFTGSWYGAPADNFNCTDPVGRNPVVMIHALSASREVDLNLLYKNMTSEGWCVYAQTYGSPIDPPLIGGLTEMTESAKDVGAYILEVAQKKGGKVDLVGHSEGGVMALYVPMTQPDVAAVIDHAIALGPAVHGAHYFGLTDFFQALPDPFPALIEAAVEPLCAACIDMENNDGDIYLAFKNSSKIVPDNINATIIMSTYDTLVPVNVSSVDEPNVRNLIVQEFCPDDHLGHADLAWSESVWGIIKNELQEVDAPLNCDTGAYF